MSEHQTDETVLRIFNEIGIIEQLARNRMERTLPHGLKISQFSVLNHFVRLKTESAPARLAAAFQVTKGAMTNTIHRLEALGFVTVIPDPADGRGKIVRITAAGEAAHAEALAALGPDLSVLSEAFGSHAFEQALPFLQRLRIYLDTHRPD